MRGQLTTVSGSTVVFTHVKLFNVLHINRMRTLQAEAENKTVPFSSPYGAIGSFSFVTGVLGANMLAEHFINSSRQQAAESLFWQSFELAERIRDRGEFVSVGEIEKIEVPLPSVWRATIRRGVRDTGRIKTVTATMIHNGDPYVVLRGDMGEVSIFWDKVEAYAVGEDRKP